MHQPYMRRTEPGRGVDPRRPASTCYRAVSQCDNLGAVTASSTACPINYYRSRASAAPQIRALSRPAAVAAAVGADRSYSTDRSTANSRVLARAVVPPSPSHQNLYPRIGRFDPDRQARLSSLSFHSLRSQSVASSRATLMSSSSRMSSKSSLSTLVSSTETIKNLGKGLTISDTESPRKNSGCCHNCGSMQHSILNCQKLSRVNQIRQAEDLPTSAMSSSRSLNIAPSNIPTAVKAQRNKLPRCNNCGLKGHKSSQCTKAPSMKDLAYFSPSITSKVVSSSPECRAYSGSSGSSDVSSPDMSAYIRRSSSVAARYRVYPDDDFYTRSSNPPSKVGSAESYQPKPRPEPRSGFSSSRSMGGSPAHLDSLESISAVERPKTPERKSALASPGNYYSLPRVRETPSKRVTITTDSPVLLGRRADLVNSDENDSGIGGSGSTEELPRTSVSVETQTEISMNKKLSKKSSFKKTIRTIGSWLSVERI